jgi:hypothetical protein
MNKLAKYGSLEGKRVFVTGGGSGIGEAIVAAFVEQGAVVAFVDIVREASEALVARLTRFAATRANGAAVPLLRHHRHPGAGTQHGRTGGELGDFDVIVNNAANDQRHQIGEVTRGLLRRAHRDQPAPHVLYGAGGPGRHEAARRRFGHQLQLDVLPRQESGLPDLRRHQGGGDRPDALPGARPWPVQHPRQHGDAGLGHDPAPDRLVAGRERRSRDQARPVPAGQADVGRRGVHGAVPGGG